MRKQVIKPATGTPETRDSWGFSRKAVADFCPLDGRLPAGVFAAYEHCSIETKTEFTKRIEFSTTEAAGWAAP